MEPLTQEQLTKVLPYKSKGQVNQRLMNRLNNLLIDPDERQAFRENLVSYTSVLMDGRFKLADYVKAVQYVSHKLLGDTNVLAYTKTFPDRYDRMVKAGKSPKAISAFVTAYSKNVLVNKIMEQTLIPNHILNQDLYQKALNVQAELMIGANSEKVRTDAANSILTHLKPPETQKMELDIGMKESPAIADLRTAVMNLTIAQKQAIESGSASVEHIAHTKIVQGEVIENG